MDKMKNSLGDRMKNYENVNRTYLVNNVPVIIRLDGAHFHSFTRGCSKPFDINIIKSMEETGKYLIENIQGCKIAYIQSDEINLFLSDYDNIETQGWFNYNVNKMVSISAAMASVSFTSIYHWAKQTNINNLTLIKPAHFDSRCFNIPKEEVINLFRWRYLDWLRNSIQMLAQSLYSQKQLHGKKSPELHEMCFQKGYNWNNLDPQFKNGTLFIREVTYDREGKLFESEIVKYTDFNLMSPEWLKTINQIVEIN